MRPQPLSPTSASLFLWSTYICMQASSISCLKKYPQFLPPVSAQFLYYLVTDSRNNWKNWVCCINFFSSYSLLHPFQSWCFPQRVASTSLCQYPQWWLSLVVQRLRTHLRMQGTWFNSWSGKIPHDSGQLSPCATTTEACMPWSPCSRTREATTVRSPRTATGEQPPLSATRESPWAASKTQHSQKERKKKTEAKKKKIEAILKERKKRSLGIPTLSNPMIKSQVPCFQASPASYLADHTWLPCSAYCPQPHAPSSSLPCCIHMQRPAQLIQTHRL